MMSTPTNTKSTASAAAFDEKNSDVSPASQPALSETLPVDQFIWGAGVECSFIPHMKVDQFEWTQHDRQWKEDLRRTKEEAGIANLRYAFPRHVLGREPGEFDWSHTNEPK